MNFLVKRFWFLQQLTGSLITTITIFRKSQNQEEARKNQEDDLKAGEKDKIPGGRGKRGRIRELGKIGSLPLSVLPYFKPINACFSLLEQVFT